MEINIALLSFIHFWAIREISWGFWEALTELCLPHEKTDAFLTSKETLFLVCMSPKCNLGIRGHCKSKDRDESAVPIWKEKYREQYLGPLQYL